jgi:hypothetical protein
MVVAAHLYDDGIEWKVEQNENIFKSVGYASSEFLKNPPPHSALAKRNLAIHLFPQ